jgi:hypothetical protein
MEMSHRKRDSNATPGESTGRRLFPMPITKKKNLRGRGDGFLVLCILVVASLILATDYVFPVMSSSWYSKDELLVEETSSPSSVVSLPVVVLPASRPTAAKQVSNPSKEMLPDEAKKRTEEVTAKSGETTEKRIAAGSTADGGSSFPVIDLISIGSNTRPEYQDMQEQTFVRHTAVRQFWRMTEHNDTDQACQQDVDVQQVFDICHRPSTYRLNALMKRHFAPRKWLLEKHSNPSGWLCAQKRPLDALHLIVTQDFYAAGLPDYLMIIDDDTWLNLDIIMPVLEREHPPAEHHVVAGCLIRSNKDARFTFHWGGFGLIWTKAVLERLLTPLFCNDKDEDVDPKHDTSDFERNNEFVKYACQRLSLNLVGEQHFFKPGMSLLQLIYQYSAQQPYTNASQWLPTATFCMHSDTTLAYFLQYYHVGQHAGNRNYPHFYQDNPLERITGYHGSTKIKASNETVKPPVYESREECLHLSNSECPKESHLCHYVTPEYMGIMFRHVSNQYGPNFRPGGGGAETGGGGHKGGGERHQTSAQSSLSGS